MSITTATQSIPFGALTVFRVVSAIENAVAAVAEWHTARRTRLELLSLSDETLADIGLMRLERY